MVYLFTLGPLVFCDYLPHEYWRHFCKGVCIVELSGQTSVPSDKTLLIDDLAMTYQLEYEQLYVQRNPENIHFVWPWIHMFLHLASEIMLKGPPAYYSQWTMEHVIGYLKEGFRLHSNPYVNLANVAVRLCQVNALKAMIPDIVFQKRTPRNVGTDLGNNYAALHPKEKSWGAVTATEHHVICDYMERNGLTPDGAWRQNTAVRCWGRLAVPNGSIVHCIWKESRLSASHLKNLKQHCKV
jgi:hypothetical protein